MDKNQLTDNNLLYQPIPDEDFLCAFNLVKSEQTHAELINYLEYGNIPQKQIAAIKLKTVLNKFEAQILLSNLTKQDGKIREAVSFKIAELMADKNLQNLFGDIKNCNIFLDAIIDINGNICRNIISALSNLKNNMDFTKSFCAKLVANTIELANQVAMFDFQEGKYKINKEVFKLYWYLETIYEFVDFIPIDKLKEILNITKSIKEYTIREKTAKILTIIHDNPELNKIKKLLKNDTNYYVRRF